MKDKLIKTGHKKSYYRMKRSLSFAFFASIFALALSLPVAISIKTVQAKAEAAEETLSSQQNVEEPTLLEYPN